MKRLLIAVVALGFAAPAVAQTANPSSSPSQIQKTQPAKPAAPKMEQKKDAGKGTVKDKNNTAKPAKPADKTKPASKDSNKAVPKQQVK